MYSVKQYLPWWQDTFYDSEYNRDRRINSANELIKNITKAIKKYDNKLSTPKKDELKKIIDSLNEAIGTKKHSDIPKLATELEDTASKHLEFAKKSPGREYFESIGVAVFIAFGLRLFAVEAFKIPSESMVPTLMVGDHIFVGKYMYGIPMPFQHKQIVKFKNPEYGDVIVFAKPSRAEQGLNNDVPPGELVGADFIKRVIGLPGDKIEVKESIVYVNDKPIPRCHIGNRTFKSKDPMSGKWVDKTSDLWVEKHGSSSYTIVEDYLFDDAEPIIVPQGQLFVMGDNRDRSSDSRYWGTVPVSNVKGRAMIVWWSNERPHGFAWSRFGNIIMEAPELSDQHEKIFERCNL
ncbi:MAG: signal peptidase I [Deltaproteobacteria bacterium]|nr:signal peptidase I [Deltaproteobacteria bacterium]